MYLQLPDNPMEADIYTRFEGDFYRILDFKCRCTDCGTSRPEYSNSFCISFVRKGNFLFNVFRQSLDSYTGCVLVTKPGYERTVTHAHTVPDECTIVDFRKGFYEQLLDQYGTLRFFTDNDLHSTLVRTTPETEFLHFQVIHLIMTNTATRLQIDNLVLEIIRQILTAITDYTPDIRITSRLKSNHLVTIERAKDYMHRHATDDISLIQLAEHCNVSPFHFSRLFKTFTATSPHQYLVTLRLKNAELLLRDTTQPIADIAFTSGFNSIEHFTIAFRQKYGFPPARFRAEILTTK